jgi:hypothetical protein
LELASTSRSLYHFVQDRHPTIHHQLEAVRGAELANSQSFLKELCDVLDVPHPEPTKAEEDDNHYVFEKHVKLNNGDGSESDGRIDLYRKGHFILESKQGSERKAQDLEQRLARPDRKRKQRTGTAVRGTQGWSNAMFKAFQQAKNYAAASPEDGWPPFLIVVDIGHCFDLKMESTF